MKNRNQQAFELSEEILKNFELSEIPTQNIVLKSLRLARLLNDIDAVEWLMQEANGYTSINNKLIPKAWEAAGKSGRRYFKNENGTLQEYANTLSIAVMEASIKISQQRMESATDPGISVSSHSTINPTLPKGNAIERGAIALEIKQHTETIEKVKSRIYQYVFNMNYELQFGNITEGIFTRKRSEVDQLLAERCPEAIQKFISVYQNLKSNNDEDWANAVHSCRRILKDVADQLYPPSETPFEREGQKPIKIGNDNYVNRLILYIEEKAESDKFISIVGSHLKYIGERIDSITEAANKGTHHEVTLEEAERYILYTYLILGDILSL